MLFLRVWLYKPYPSSLSIYYTLLEAAGSSRHALPTCGATAESGGPCSILGPASRPHHGAAVRRLRLSVGHDIWSRMDLPYTKVRKNRSRPGSLCPHGISCVMGWFPPDPSHSLPSRPSRRGGWHDHPYRACWTSTDILSIPSFLIPSAEWLPWSAPLKGNNIT